MSDCFCLLLIDPLDPPFTACWCLLFAKSKYRIISVCAGSTHETVSIYRNIQSARLAQESISKLDKDAVKTHRKSVLNASLASCERVFSVCGPTLYFPGRPVQ